jgi:hypothetical protein
MGACSWHHEKATCEDCDPGQEKKNPQAAAEFTRFAVELTEDERIELAWALACKAYGELNRTSAHTDRAELHSRYEQCARLMARAAELTRAT